MIIVEGAGSAQIWKEQVIVLLFHCVSFVETKKISTFVTPSMSKWEESPCPPSPKEVVLLLKNAISQGSGPVLLDLS